jgi:hypothetical protein
MAETGLTLNSYKNLQLSRRKFSSKKKALHLLIFLFQIAKKLLKGHLSNKVKGSEFHLSSLWIDPIQHIRVELC